MQEKLQERNCKKLRERARNKECACLLFAFLSLSVCPFIIHPYFSIASYIHVLIYSTFYYPYLKFLLFIPPSHIRPPVGPSIRLSVNPSISQSVGKSIHPSIRRSVSKSIHPSIHPSVNQSVSQSVRQSVRQSVSQSIRPSVCPSIRLELRASSFELRASSWWGPVVAAPAGQRQRVT